MTLSSVDGSETAMGCALCELYSHSVEAQMYTAVSHLSVLTSSEQRIIITVKLAALFIIIICKSGFGFIICDPSAVDSKPHTF